MALSIGNMISSIRNFASLAPAPLVLPDAIAGLLQWLRGDETLYTGGARQYTAASLEYHSRADNAFFSAGDIDFYIATWVYFDSVASNHAIIGKWDFTNNDREYLLWTSTSTTKFEFSVSSDGTAANTTDVDSTLAPAVNTWYFVQAWHDATANKIYISVNDQTTPNEAVHTTGCNDNVSPFVLGSDDTSATPTLFMDGRISRLYFAKNAAARALIDDSSLRTWLYNSGNGRVAGEVAAHATLGTYLDGTVSDYWNLNEASGNALSYSGSNDLTDNATVTSANGPAVSLAQDDSANANIGTLTGFGDTVNSAWKTDTPDGTFDPTCQDTSGNDRHLGIVGATVASASDTAGSEYPRDASVPAGIGSTGSLEFDGTLYGLVTTSPFYQVSATELAVEFYCDIESADFNGTLVNFLASTATDPGVTDGIRAFFDDRGGANQATDGIKVVVATAVSLTRAVEYDNIIGGLSAGFHKYKITYDSTNFIRLWIDDVLQTISNTSVAGTGNFVPRNNALGVGAGPDGSSVLPSGVRLDRVRLYSDAAATTLIAEYGFDETNLRSLSTIGSGLSLQFDGTNDYVVAASSINPNVTVMTASAWFKATSFSNLDTNGDTANIVTQEDGTGTGRSWLYVERTSPGVFKLHSYIGGSATIGSAVSISTGVWHHAAVKTSGVGSGSTISIYLDGRLLATSTGDPAAADGNLRFGAHKSPSTSSEEWTGMLDEIRVFNVAKTAAEIYSLYTGTDDTTGLQGHWKFDDGPQEPVADQDPVIEWLSKEGTKYQFQQATAAKRPLARLAANGINNKTAVEFDGADDLLVLSSAPLQGESAFSLTFAIKTPASFSGDQVFWASSDEATALNYLFAAIDTSGKVCLEVNDGGVVYRATGDTVLSVSTDYLVTIKDTGTAIEIDLDGAAETISETGTYKGIADLTGLDNTTLGALKHTSETKHYSGQVAEKTLYNVELSDADQNNLEQTLSTRYAIPVT